MRPIVAAVSGILLTLDALSALLEIGVAAYFLLLWRTSRRPLHLLFALGLALVGLTFSVVSASEFQLGGRSPTWDHIRIAGQTGGALVILAAYWSARASGHPRIGLTVGYALAGLTLVFAVLFFAIPPTFGFAADRKSFIFAHATMALVWAASAMLAFPRSSAAFTRERLLVPAAFLCFAVGKYSWMLQDIADDASLVPFVYPWRFLGLALMIGAIALPPRGGPA